MKKLLISGISLALTLVSCGSAQAVGGLGASPDGDTRTPRPLNVQITPDSARTVEGTLTPAGGSLSATAADGTTFTLTAPENAVLSSLKVKMTPVSGLTGLNGAQGYLAAVHLEPEGMEFLEPLSLRITAPHALDAGTLRGLNSHALGSEFYFQGRSVEGRTATLQLLHFSNPGVASVADGVPVPVPTDPRDRLENDLARKNQDSLKVLGDYAVWVEGDLRRAEASDAALRKATRSFLTWRKEVERLGLSDRFKAEIFQGWSLIARGIESAVERAHAECVVNSDFRRVIDILGWVSWVKRNPRLAPYFGGKLAKFEQQALGCASFELAFDFQLTERVTKIQPASGFTQTEIRSTHHLKAQLPVRYSLEFGYLTGQAPLETRDFTAQGFFNAIEHKDQGCPVSAGPVQAGPFGFVVGGNQERRSEIPLVSLLIEPGRTPRELQTLTLVALPGSDAHLLKLRCPDSPERLGEIAPHQDWWTLFPELNGGARAGWWDVPLEFQGGVAEYRQDHQYSGAPLGAAVPEPGIQMVLGGSTTLTLRHTPQ